jgi:hypothetical protein
LNKIFKIGFFAVHFSEFFRYFCNGCKKCVIISVTTFFLQPRPNRRGFFFVPIRTTPRTDRQPPDPTSGSTPPDLMAASPTSPAAWPAAAPRPAWRVKRHISAILRPRSRPPG